MHRLAALLLVVSAATASAQVPAAPAKPTNPAVMAAAAIVEQDVARIKDRYPKTQFVSITPTQIPGLYQAIMANKRLAYIESSGRYFVFGRIFDMDRQEDLTEPVLATFDTIDVAALPVADAIKVVRGTGKRTLYVFSDPDCPFCRQLEASLAQVTDVTIYTFVFPISDIHPQARTKAVAVWCSPDRATAWNTVAAGKPAPNVKHCDHPIDRNVELARSLNIRATPTMVSGDGRILRGAAASDRIAAFLDNAKVAVSQVSK
jgi:thiol:disulfide interchange protein DsbC